MDIDTAMTIFDSINVASLLAKTVRITDCGQVDSPGLLAELLDEFLRDEDDLREQGVDEDDDSVLDVTDYEDREDGVEL